MERRQINLKTATEIELRDFEAFLLSSPKTNENAHALMKIHETLAAREFPELEYREFIQSRHNNGHVNAYLEVGVRWGDAIRLAKPGCMAVGVDPAFNIKHDLPADPTLYATTSDDFFFEHTETYKDTFDLIFLDGLHEARQTAKDIYHALNVLKPGGEILVHDTLPISLAVTAPTQQSRFWTGNVWQAAYAFAVKDFPLKWEFVEARPSGLLRLYDIEPGFLPSRNMIMQRVAEASRMKFGESRDLLNFLREL